MQGYPVWIAVSDTGVYWVDEGSGAEGSGTVMGMLQDGGNVITLASGQTDPLEVLVNANNVFWSAEPRVNSSSTLAILSVPIDGGLSSAIVSEPVGGWPFAVDARNVYWSLIGTISDAGDLLDGTGEILFAPLDGGVAEVLASGQNQPAGLVVDAQNIYWANSGTMDAGWADGAIMKAQLDGGGVAVLAGPRTYPVLVTIDSANIYWCEQFAVVRVSLDGGAPVVLASYPSLFNVDGIATDETNVYWTVYADGTVMSAPLDGGFTTTIFQGQHPGAVAVDATSVYWTDEGNGTVMKATPK
jgi:hypothetical protein